MMRSKSKIEQWFSSKETKEILDLSDCQLMHLRVSGKIKFKKKGNAFLYLLTIDKPDNE